MQQIVNKNRVVARVFRAWKHKKRIEEEKRQYMKLLTAALPDLPPFPPPAK